MGAKQCDITAYGAKESSSENSGSIQAAAEDCRSGGEVVVPSGVYRTLPLEIPGASDFKLTLSDGAVLQGLPRSSWPIKNARYVTFLHFDNCQRCTLQGQGILDGQGTPWYKDFDDGKIKDHRPDFVVFNGGSDIKVMNVTLLNAPMFNLALSNVARGEIGGINITSHWYNNEKTEPHNTDAIDPGSNSHDIWIHDVYVYNGDDGVAIKPGSVSGGCTRNILVENSHFERGHGLSIGSVGSGCVKDVIFRNIKLSGKGTQCGCRIKTYSNQPGFVHNITWENIEITDTAKCITVNANYKPAPAGATDFIEVSDINFRNIRSTSCSTDAEFLCPGQKPCKDIQLDGVHLSGGKGMQCSNAYGSAKNSLSSCLKAPSPAPSPVPSPPGCDMNSCFARCESKYGGHVDDGSGGDAYMCAKGCATMKDGHVQDTDVFCKMDASKREATCMSHCSSASSDASRVAKCEYGCGFWSASHVIL